MSRKGESIYKRKDGRWQGRYIRGRDDNGKAIYGYVYGKSYAEAKEKKDQKLAEIVIAKSKQEKWKQKIEIKEWFDAAKVTEIEKWWIL